MWGYCLITSNRSDDFSLSTSVSAVAKTDALRGPPTSRDISPKNSPSPSSSRTNSCPSTSLITLPPPRLIKYIASPSSPSAMMRSPAMSVSGSSLSTIAPNSSLEKAANSGLISFLSFTGAGEGSLANSRSITGTDGSGISLSNAGAGRGGGISISGAGAAIGGGGAISTSTCSAASGAGGGGGGASPVTPGVELMALMSSVACFSP